MCRRPAVSMSTTSQARFVAAARAARQTSTGSAPAGVGCTGTPICSPSVVSCSMAAGPVDVGGDQIRTAPALRLQVAGELGDRRRLAGALQADDHDHHRRRRREVELDGAVAHQLGQLGADDLDEVLLGRQAAEHLLAERLAAHALGEVARDLEVDVGLEQRQAHLAHGVLDVALGDLAVPAQPLDGLLELVAEGVEHAAGVAERRAAAETGTLQKAPPGVNERPANAANFGRSSAQCRGRPEAARAGPAPT